MSRDTHCCPLPVLGGADDIASTSSSYFSSLPFPLPVPLSPIRRLQSTTLHAALIGPSSSLVPSLLHQHRKTSAIQAPTPSQVERNFLLSHYILQYLLQLAEVPFHPSSEAALNRHFRHLIFILHRRKTSLHTSQTETGSELGSTSSRTALSAWISTIIFVYRSESSYLIGRDRCILATAPPSFSIATPASLARSRSSHPYTPRRSLNGR